MQKIFSLLLLVLCSVSAYPQEQQVSVGAVFTPLSRGTGDGPSIGVRADAVLEINQFARFVGEASWAIEEKLYIGDGSGNAFRGRAELRAQWPGRGYYVSPFVGAGVSVVRKNTSQYSKTGVHPIITTGLNFQDKVIPYVRWYLPEHTTPNKGRAFEYGSELFFPLAEDSPWLIRAGIAGIRSTFWQPSGPLQGWRHAHSMRLHMGAGYRF